MRGRRLVALLGLVTMVLVAGPVTLAWADSGGATVSTLPESGSLQVSAEIHHECSESCAWFAEAAAYSASVGCPSVYDGSHGVWVGSVETTGGTSFGNFSFNPYGLESTIIVCLYVNADSNDSLVGESHPFDRSRGSEVLPQAPQPPPRYPARTTAWVSVRGCRAWPHIAVNGEKNVGGNITWAMYRWKRHRWSRMYGETSEVTGAFTPGTFGPGAYRFAARFLGDDNLLPSRSSASATFHVKHC